MNKQDRDDPAYFLTKAQQCRRLAVAMADSLTWSTLQALAGEYEAKALAAQAHPAALAPAELA